MIDLKTLKSAMEQLEEERGIPAERIIGAIEDALVAAYKKDYGKKGQIVRAKFDLATGAIEFHQVKVVVDDNMLRSPDEPTPELDDGKVKFDDEHHIMLVDAQKIKQGVAAGEELIFPLDTEVDYGRIAAQTAKQVIIQRIREAEKQSVMAEFQDRQGQIVSGRVQKIELGNVFVDLGRATGLLSREEQIPGEHYRPGERVKSYLYLVEETPRGINLRLSRAHPQLIAKLFEVEAPEIANGAVVIKAIAREAGGRTKIAVATTESNIDPVGACVGQRGVRVNTVINELGGEKIDIIEWSDDTATFITHALSPAKIIQVTLEPEEHRAQVTVEPDQFSLAVGKGGQNARLAARLSGWKIDINSPHPVAEDTPPVVKSEE